MNNLNLQILLNFFVKIAFLKFSSRFARPNCFLIFSTCSSLHSFGILETLFTFISINCLTKPESINAFIYLSLQISNSIYQQ